MKIFTEKLKSYQQCPSRFLGFEKYADQAGDFLLVAGSAFDQDILNKYPDKKVLIEFDEPNRYYYPPELMRPKEYEASFSKIFTICPYSADWMNKIQGNEKRTFTFFPFNEDFIPPKTEKKFDVIYTGHILAKPISDIIDEMRHFNYCVVSNTPDERVTHRGASNLEKIRLMAESRITIVHNLHFMDSYHVANLQGIENYWENAAFSKVPRRSSWLPVYINRIFKTVVRLARKVFKKFSERVILVPHIKSRTFEAAFTRSLMLVQKDPFNIIERFFEPDKEFVYFEPGHLQEKIREILANYPRYADMIERAYNRAVREYTTKVFFEKYLKNLKI